MKRILYVEGCKDGTVGGSHTCLYSLVVNLDRQRFYPVVIFYDDHNIAVRLRNLGIETHVFKKYLPLDIGRLLKKAPPPLGKISLLFLPLQKFANFVWTFLLPALLYSLYLKKNNINIVHLNNSLNSNHEWMLAANLAGIKIISHERGISEYLSRTSKLMANTLDLQICVSKAISYPLLRQGLNESKVMVVYDGIDISQIRCKSQPGEVKTAYHIGNNDPVIGVVGNIKEWKGQETVVRATAILKKTWPGIKCLLVGGGVNRDHYKLKLERIIEELEIGNNVRFTGFQDNPADFINVMDVVVHSSLQPEPFGMVNLEAMYMKKPVVATNMGGPLEIFNDGVDGILIEPGNPELLARKVSDLLNNPRLMRAMGEAAHEKVLCRFTISSTVNHVERIYEEMCQK